MPIYTPAGHDVQQVVDYVVGRYHGQLDDLGVTIDVLMAWPKKDQHGEPVDDAPLKHQGYPAAAVIRKIGYKDRVAGRGDAEITIDGDRWSMLTVEEQRALIDHELTHLEVATDKDGGVKRDDLDRVCFKIRLHDHQIGVFDSVVRRHGRNALDYQVMERFVNGTWSQLWLPFVEAADEEAA